MAQANRKSIDCRKFLNEIGCTLLISGSEKEVFKTALRHAIEEHGHQDTFELRKQIKAMMKNESPNHKESKKILKGRNKRISLFKPKLNKT